MRGADARGGQKEKAGTHRHGGRWYRRGGHPLRRGGRQVGKSSMGV